MMDMVATLENVVVTLQRNPERYKWFGLYWWPLKRLLEHVGYCDDQLYMLGNYFDPGQSEVTKDLSLEGMLSGAMEEFGSNARTWGGHADGVVEDPDGELITIYDQDADQ
jgi:hypothetical protein